MIETPMVERLTSDAEEGQPSEIAATAVWLYSDQASFVTGHAMAMGLWLWTVAA